MLCPFCEIDDDKVIDSRTTDGTKSIRRRRECQRCKRRFTTFERVEQTSRLMVIKRDGTRVPFQTEKVLQGLLAACGKRPIPEDKKVAIVRDVEEELMQSFDREVPSHEIGIRVANQLKSLDSISYIRYASEYFNFQNLDDFSNEVSVLQEEPPVIPSQNDLFSK
ncbi:MAG: transcriptional regulator NrdR [Alphaproteobacteria bacterium]|nr:transcriptional regulator NrdR [Alphaproteobacteria bacterium]